MSHGHHGGGGFHHGGHHHHHHYGGYRHHRHMGGRIGLPLFGWPLLGVWGPRYHYRPRYRRGGCSLFALLFGILIFFAFIHFWWLLIPLVILAVLGMRSLLRSLTGRPAGPGANYQAYQANNQQFSQPYQQGYSAPPSPGSGYQPYPPQSGWGQYDMPQAQYPQNMPPMP